MSTTTLDRPAAAEAVPASDAYLAPSVNDPARLRAAQLAFWIYVVLIVVILTLGGVAIFCILKGHKLKWAQKGWTHWTIACE